MLAMRNQLPNLSTVIALGAEMDGAVSFAEVVAHEPTPIPNPPVGGDPMLLLYTSGTTSNPKGVPLSYQNMLSNARMSASEFGFTAYDRILSAAPFSHLYGLFAMHMTFYVGATVVLLPLFTPPDLAKTVSIDKPTALFMGPPHAAAMLGMGLLDQHDFSSVRISIFSGSACPPQVLRDYVGKIGGGEACQLWGMTELQAGTYTRPGDATELSATTAGRPSPGTEIAVVDGAGKTLPAGEEGELRVRGCSVFPGYLNNPTANANEFSEGGWFTTGDLAVIDADGNLAITGRIKDVINRGGVKFNPLDVENVLLRHPKVAEAAIVPMPDPVLGEKACLFITKAGEDAPSLEELCAFLEAQQVVKNRWPERLEIVEAMPLTPTRKIIKARLAALL
jgi:acyl-CoA synthetase (AMP-forming)/AMP-acid ligase II